MQLNNFHFLCFHKLWHLILTYYWVIFDFLGPNRLFLGLGQSSKTFLGSTHVVVQLSFCIFLSILALFLLIFLLFWVLMGWFGIGVKFDNCFGVYSCSYSTFILYVSVNSGIGFYLVLGLFLTFWGPIGLFLGLGQGLTTVMGSTHIVEQLSFSMFLSILTFDFDLILRSFLSFWGPN